MEEQPALNEASCGTVPWGLFARWYGDAQAQEPDTAEMMTLATASCDGVPSARIVLLRGFDERGFVFFTNYHSRKGQELTDNPRAALVLHWTPFQRQVRIEGSVEKVSAQESDAYFRQRPFGNQLSALASPQSRVIGGREELDRRMEELARKYAGKDVPRPEHWGGFRVVPHTIEFWQGGEHRVHDRIRFRRQADGNWLVDRLAP